MPLIIAPIGKELTIKRVSGDEKIKKHLESLGIIPDRKITLFEKTKSGVIVLINDTRLALDKDVAMAIVVIVD